MYTVTTEFHGKTLTIETGRIAKQTNGTALVTCGDSVVLVTVCMGESRGFDFLPLTIEYIEKAYAGGKIPGGFFKREGKLSDSEVLTSRLIDRPCRPMFPEGMSNELQVIATVLSADPEVPTDVLAMTGASAALTVSDIPFNGPIAGVRVCRVNGKLMINPSMELSNKAELQVIVAGSRDAILMVEGGAQIVPEAEVLDAIFYAHQEMQALINMQLDLAKQCGKEKVVIAPVPPKDAALVAKVKAEISNKLETAIMTEHKHARGEAISALKKSCVAAIVKADDANAEKITTEVKAIFEDEVYEKVRSLAFDKKVRIDGRDFVTVRPINIEVGFLPRVHGSALFTRGETQGIVTATLAVGNDSMQRIETLHQDYQKRFSLHYNFPGYSVGEAKPMRGVGRREVGHGALAERALIPVVPTDKSNPYVIRIVSDITESNGSSSMASVCGGTMALMDAGIKIKAPVAGVAMGLLKREEDFVVLTDILGDEDHLGDMDFKICGTDVGVTAIQMDIKIAGLSKEIMTQALEQARVARLHILSVMKEAMAEPRSIINPKAPQIEVIKINPGKIRDLIGSGGKTIKSITDVYKINIDIQDDGTVTVSGSNAEQMSAGLKVIKAHTAEAEIGKIYQGIVKRIESFGAFVEILPGTDGLLHVSEISDERTEDVNDVLAKGDQVPVKVLNVDSNGKIKLSRREAMADMGM